MTLGLIACTSILIGFILLDIKCDAFGDDINICDIPNYCPNKDKCDGSM